MIARRVFIALKKASLKPSLLEQRAQNTSTILTGILRNWITSLADKERHTSSNLNSPIIIIAVMYATAGNLVGDPIFMKDLRAHDWLLVSASNKPCI